MLRNYRNIRDQKGAAITGLVIALMFFILISGLFCFDASRVQMAQRELTATCDASALAGTAMLTSYDVSDDPGYTKLANAQQNAAAFAYNMFNMGNVLGGFLQGHSSLVTDLNQLGTTTDGEAKVVIGLVDPKDSYRVIDPTPPNNANGRAIAVFAGYGYHPIFISFYGVGNVGILASSIGGLPQVDAILVFDYSGSMDDLTKVTLIKRWWNANPTGGIGYTGSDPDSRGWSVRESTIEAAYGGLDIPGLIGSHTRGCIQYDEAPHPTTNQSLLEYVDLDTVAFLQGTSLNCLPPQNLANSELGTLLENDEIIVFKMFLRHHPFRNDYDSPPGNCPAFIQSGGFWANVNNDVFSYFNPNATPIEDQPTAHDWYPTYSGRDGQSSVTNSANIYTDLVVNISAPSIPAPAKTPVQPLFGPDQFAPMSFTFPGTEDDPTIRGNNYTFDNIACVVEAARGNRETTTNRDDTGLHRGYILNAAGLTNQYRGSYNGMTTRRGYQKAYQRLAMWHSQPIAGALDGADQGFFQKLSALADCRFGFVGFSDSDPFPAAPNATSMATPHTGIWGGAQGTPAYPGKNSFYYDVNYTIALGTTNPLIWDNRYRDETPAAPGNENRPHENTVTQQAGGNGFRIPRAQLNTSLTQQESLDLVTKGGSTTTVAWSHPNRGDGLYNGRPLSGTMCYEALETARREFGLAAYDGLSRAGSKRAIVFFTDGIPSGGVGSAEASSSAGVADACAADGIAIFSIGLNMLGNPSLTADQTTFLGNGSGGLSGRAKNGGRFFECSDVQGIKEAFSAIARRLTQSQR